MLEEEQCKERSLMRLMVVLAFIGGFSLFKVIWMLVML